MKNPLDTGGYTDLVCERRKAFGEKDSFKRMSAAVGVWERAHISEQNPEKNTIRTAGHYHSLHTGRLENADAADREEIAEELASELWSLCELNSITPKRILAVGLGNERLAPDALGPLAAKKIEATLHWADEAPELLAALGCSEISVIRPGVKAESGIDCSQSVSALCKLLSPNLVIVIDALCTVSEERLGTTFQLSDSGIRPGSGVGNPHGELSKETLGVSVITVGVPTVIDAGLISERIRGERLLVTPRYINPIVDVGAGIIADAINRAFGIVR